MKSPTIKALLCVLVLFSVVSAVSAQEIKNTSYTAPDGMRVLRHELIVDAERQEVWKAFTTSEGWKSWAVPVAFVDFRRGGTIETSYDWGGLRHSLRLLREGKCDVVAPAAADAARGSRGLGQKARGHDSAWRDSRRRLQEEMTGGSGNDGDSR